MKKFFKVQNKNYALTVSGGFFAIISHSFKLWLTFKVRTLLSLSNFTPDSIISIVQPVYEALSRSYRRNKNKYMIS